MKKIDVVRAWRDEEYYLSLTEEERASLGDHPAGAVKDDVLASITGGCGPGGGENYTPSTACKGMNGQYIYCF